MPYSECRLRHLASWGAYETQRTLCTSWAGDRVDHRLRPGHEARGHRTVGAQADAVVPWRFVTADVRGEYRRLPESRRGASAPRENNSLHRGDRPVSRRAPGRAAPHPLVT